MKQDTLFLFTKKFPYSTAEQYLVDEIPFLAESFKRVILVPCELFDRGNEKIREIGSNVEVLHLNNIASQETARRRIGEFVSVFFSEWMRCRNKLWFWKERKRYSSVLMYQSHVADVLTKYLKDNCANERVHFYAYWIHNSSVMLSLMKKRGVIEEFVVRGHSIDLYEWDWVLTRYIKILPFYNFILRNASRVYSISEHGQKYLQKRFPENDSRFRCAHLGVIDGGTNPYNSGSMFTIVSCSNFSANKRVDFIARIIGSMKHPVRWIHFGDGPGRENTEKVLEQLPLHAKAELKGFVPNEVIRKFYKDETVNLVINMSEAEGVPVSLMEAISFGIPVMATAVYGSPEVANEESGFSIPFEADAATIAATIDQFALDPAMQAIKRRGARELYSRKFSAIVNYKAFTLELLAEV